MSVLLSSITLHDVAFNSPYLTCYCHELSCRPASVIYVLYNCCKLSAGVIDAVLLARSENCSCASASDINAVVYCASASAIKGQTSFAKTENT